MQVCNKKKISISLLFILSVVLLAINDHFLKATFPCWLTGKLSDFAGLFALPVFLCILFPKRRAIIYIFVFLFFIYWKSSFSAPLIQLLNSILFFKIGRTIDYTDLIALSILPLSYYYSLESTKKRMLKIYPVLLYIPSILIFTATSYTNIHKYDKQYKVEASAAETLIRINNLASHNSPCSNLPLALNYKNADTVVMYQGDSAWFSINKDSITNSDFIQYDSMYIPPSGIFNYSIPVRKYMMESNTGYCDCLPAKIQLTEENGITEIKLVTFEVHNCMGMFEKEAELHEKDNLMNAFEKEVVSRIIAAQ